MGSGFIGRERRRAPLPSPLIHISDYATGDDDDDD